MNKDKKEISNFDKVDVVVLCGGFGKRLRSVVKDRPKSMASLNGRPFLELLIDYFSNYGSKRFILCTGFKGKFIENYFKKRYCDKDIVISHEENPLGTGGAIKNALPLIESSPFFVLNGDSFCKINLPDFYRFHLNHNALASIALIRVNNVKRFGSVDIDHIGRILKFNEKVDSTGSGWINVGIYIMNKDIFSFLPKNKAIFSLEYDLFPKLIGRGLFGMKVYSEIFVDIGTPESFYKAQSILQNPKI